MRVDAIQSRSLTAFHGAARPAPSISPGRLEEEAPRGGKERGVLRHVREAHYNGVADLRHRIKLFDELGAVDSATLRSRTSERIDSLRGQVDQAVEAFAGFETLGEEQSATVTEALVEFHSAIDAVVDSLAASDFGAQPLTAELTSALDRVLESLAGLGETSEIDGLQELVDGLRATTTARIAEISEEISTTEVLPEISHPNGNGRAFGKFLAIYQAMVAGTAAAEPPELDTVG